MTELGFLLDLLLDEELPLPIKKRVAGRIKDVEQSLTTQPQRPIRAQQAPSMQRIMDEAAQDIAPEVIASPAAAQAIAQRQAMINQAGKIDPNRSSPRKF